MNTYLCIFLTASSCYVAMGLWALTLIKKEFSEIHWFKKLLAWPHYINRLLIRMENRLSDARGFRKE